MNTRETRERLIDEVKRCPVLYDTRHERHRDIDARDRCWTEIAERLGTNSEVLKREWKILRDSLRQAIKNVGATTKAGTPCKRWRYQQRMAFVLPHMTRRGPRQPLTEHIKMDAEPASEAEPEEPEVWEPPEEGRETGEAAPPRDGEGAALELFFASVCASARRLPRRAQRALKRQVLDALLRAEAEQEPAPAPAAKPEPCRRY